VVANDPGTTTQAYKNAVAARVNWIRGLAGVPAVIALDPTYSAKDQKAALMFSANRQISHNPPNTWMDYTSEAAEAAANSNICYGFASDPGCAEAYLLDWGANNTAAGHRRWILYPQTSTMGTGDVPQSGPAQNPYPPANALWVFDGNYGTARPATREQYVAWPPPGFVPYRLVGPRWSFSYAGADFTSASVSMQRSGSAIPVRLETVQNGYGENTLVWIPDNQDPSAYPQLTPPASDTPYLVSISNVIIGGNPQNFSYTVTIFDPDTDPSDIFAFLPSSISVGYGAATGFANLTVTPSSASWTAASSANWLSLSNITGSGSTAIGWAAAATSSSLPRTATIRAAGATFTVNQAGMPCTFSLSPASATMAAVGGSGSFTATAVPTDCSFGSYSWTGAITVSASFTASGVLTFSCSAGANGTAQPRIFQIKVAGQTFTITQDAPGQPALTISKSHMGSFYAGQSAAIYTVLVTNNGNAATSGTVTVTDALPTGLSGASAAGSGWSCLTPVTCSRADALAAGSTYPAIAITVNVASNAPAQLSNNASVTGGSSATSTASDPTTILPHRTVNDFNADGNTDMIWQDPATGLAQVWLLGGSQGASVVGAANLTASNSWRIVGVGDFNQDGKPDVVWQDPVSGAAQVWFLGGPQGNVVTSAAVLSSGNSWRIRAVADFNADGIADLVWQDPVTGLAQIWLMGGPQGNALLSSLNLTASNSWRIAGSADFNGDGKPDILWQDPVSGATQVWYLGGAQGNVVANSANLAGTNTWRIAAVLDLNRDGHPDLVWQDPASGLSQAWFMQGSMGTTVSSYSALSGANSWRIMGPK
jgi:uncharacterized repeat protein (TIGR01451 family)